MILPSVVHLAQNHFAALLREQNGYIEVADPTMGKFNGSELLKSMRKPAVIFSFPQGHCPWAGGLFLLTRAIKSGAKGVLVRPRTGWMAAGSRQLVRAALAQVLVLAQTSRPSACLSGMFPSLS